MPRYFIELSYMGTRYSGFQVQHNANTVQAEMEKAMEILLKEKVVLTGSSRTDAGVHARQNYFHFDTGAKIGFDSLKGKSAFVYNINAILPGDIAVRRLLPVPASAHCRFDAVSREYHYYIYRRKDPFLAGRAFFFPYTLDFESMQKAAGILKEYSDFTSFSKRNTQVKSFDCRIMESNWEERGDQLCYRVKANRFLRGMVRGLTATMLRVGRGKLSLGDFRTIIESRDCTKSSFAAPPQGLFLMAVEFPGTFPATETERDSF